MLNAISSADQARASRLSALAVAAVAVLICLWAIVKIGWLAVPQSDDAAAVAATAPATTSKPPVSIAKWHLFGNAEGPLASQLARNAPATTLKLTLRGTLSLPDPKQGIAMIADDHGAESAYKVGEEITDRAVLAEVYADHVVLSHEGVSETLNLPRPEEHVARSRNEPAQHRRDAGRQGIEHSACVRAAADGERRRRLEKSDARRAGRSEQARAAGPYRARLRERQDRRRAIVGQRRCRRADEQGRPQTERRRHRHQRQAGDEPDHRHEFRRQSEERLEPASHCFARRKTRRR